MPTNAWLKSPTITKLAGNTSELSFYQLLFLLEEASGTNDTKGWLSSIKFKSNNSMGMAPGDVSHIRTSSTLEIIVNFVSLAVGAAAVLPEYFISETSKAHKTREYSLADFCDMFVQKICVNYYLIWRQYSWHKITSTQKNKQHGIKKTLASLMGYHQPINDMNDDFIYYFTGLLSQHSRNSTNLKNIIEYVFQIPCKIDECKGEWLTLNTSDQTAIGESGRYQVLSSSAALGNKVWDVEHSFQVKLGPLNAKQFSELLPNQPKQRVLTNFIRFYVGGSMSCTICLILDKNCLSQAQLGSTSQYLGWNCWVNTESINHHVNDTIFKGDNPWASN